MFERFCPEPLPALPEPVRQEARQYAQRADMHHDAIYGGWYELRSWPEYNVKLMMRTHAVIDKWGVRHLEGAEQEIMLCPIGYSPVDDLKVEPSESFQRSLKSQSDGYGAPTLTTKESAT